MPMVQFDKIHHNYFTVEKPSGNRLKQVIKINIISNKMYQHHVPSNTMH